MVEWRINREGEYAYKEKEREKKIQAIAVGCRSKVCKLHALSLPTIMQMQKTEAPTHTGMHTHTHTRTPQAVGVWGRNWAGLLRSWSFSVRKVININ